jgi:hypothetical protein
MRQKLNIFQYCEISLKSKISEQLNYLFLFEKYLSFIVLKFHFFKELKSLIHIFTFFYTPTFFKSEKINSIN